VCPGTCERVCTVLLWREWCDSVTESGVTAFNDAVIVFSEGSLSFASTQSSVVGVVQHCSDHDTHCVTAVY
jgi:hypothetical protein